MNRKSVPAQSVGQTTQKITTGFWSDIRHQLQDMTKSKDAKYFTSHMFRAIDRWKKTGEAAELDAAISYAQKAVDSVPSGLPARVELLRNLWMGLNTRFRIFHQTEDLNGVINCQEEAVALVQQNHPNRCEILKELGIAFYLRYQASNIPGDLDQAVTHGEKALSTMEPEHTDYAKQLASLMARLGQRYERSGSLEDLNQAIMYGQQAVDVTPKDDPIYLSYLDDLLVNLMSRYVRTQKEEDLERAILSGQQLVKDVRANDPAQPNYLTHVGNFFHTRFLSTEKTEDLNQAMEYGHQALKVTQKDHPDYSLHVGSLGLRYMTLYTRFGRLEDLNQAVLYQKTAVDLGRDHRDYPTHLLRLGVTLLLVFQVKSYGECLDQAMSYVQQAAELIKNHQFLRLKCLHELGLIFLARFEQDRQQADLQKAEKHIQYTIEALPTSHPDHARALCTLGSILRNRSEVTGATSDMDYAIVYGEQSMKVSGESGPDHAFCSANLGLSLFNRFQRTGHMADLDLATQHLQTAVDVTPEESPQRSEYLANLSSVLSELFKRTQQKGELNRSIAYGEEALRTISESHILRPVYLSNLAEKYGLRFKVDQMSSDLDRVFRYQQEALKITPADHPEYTKHLERLGSAYVIRYDQTGEMTDLDQAILYSRRAMNSSSKEHPDRTMFLYNYGHQLFRQALSIDPLGSQRLRESTEAFRDALSSSSGLPLHRVIAGFCAAAILAMEDDWEGIIKVLDQTLMLIPKVVLPTNSRDDMQHILPKLRGLGVLAASVFHKAHRSPLDSLYAIESCRGIIASFSINARFNSTPLRDTHHDLWSKYKNTQEEIASISPTASPSLIGNTLQQNITVTTTRLQNLQRDLDEIRDEIRTDKGFERFLLSPTEEGIKELAKNGAIVCLNSSAISSEAFLVTTKRIWVFTLPNLDEDDMSVSISQFGRGIKSRTRDALLVDEDGEGNENTYFSAPDLPDRLNTIWSAAVKPILQELGFLKDSSRPITEVLPRVWWVGGGKSGFTPWHAAGDHSPGSTENTISHVVSSYATSLKALQFIQQKDLVPTQGRKPEVLLVSMPTTPGYSNLNVKDEVTSIAEHANSWASVTSLEHPSKEEVLSALQSCTIAHFACHGAADRANPAKSALLLGRKSIDQEITDVERLTVTDLDNISSNYAQLVYLSACSTAENKVGGLSDENIHLAGTLQLFGFQHVICTLCSTDDDASVEVAKEFYKRLEFGIAKDTDRSVAEALHKAVLDYRSVGNNWTNISRWAPFVHLGC